LSLVVLKQAGAASIAALNILLLLWAVIAYSRRQPLPDIYYKLLPISAAMVGATWLLGMGFLAMGLKAHFMHILYGTLVGLGALGQFAVRKHTATGRRFANRQLVHAFLALFCLLLTARAWMQA